MPTFGLYLLLGIVMTATAIGFYFEHKVEARKYKDNQK